MKKPLRNCALFYANRKNQGKKFRIADPEREASALLIDEPGSGLDRLTADEIYALLLWLKENRHVTTVVVTHDVVGPASWPTNSKCSIKAISSFAARPAIPHLRERALIVSKYRESHFHLKPKRVGIMPLGDRPPPHTGKKHWNGICLALVAWRK